MVAPYTLRWDQAFENDMKTLFSKQLIKYPHILSTSKRASIGEFPSEISVERLLRRTTIIMHEHVFCFQTITNLYPSTATKNK